MMETSIISSFEVGKYVEELRPFSISDIGNARWMKQHDHLQALNKQAHYTAMIQAEEVVMESIITHSKFPVLVHELLAIEIWSQHVAPLLLAEITKFPTKSYFLLFQESVLVNLLEITLYHKSACVSADECLVELADYCYRKIVHLTTRKDDSSRKKTPQELLKLTTEEELRERQRETEFATCISSLTIVRYMTDYISDLSISLTSRLLDFYDIICILVPLIEKPPWMRYEKGVCFKYQGGQWEKIEREKVVQPEVQVWLALYNLMIDPECRKKYNYTENRKETVLKLKDHITETLIDQIPILADLRRLLEHLVIMDPPPPNSRTGVCIIEQIPEMRDNLMKGQNWKEIAENQRKNVFGGKSDDDIERLVKHFDKLEELLPPPKCAVCGEAAPKKCSRCKNEWYCSRECQLKGWKAHKEICDIISQDLKNK